MKSTFKLLSLLVAAAVLLSACANAKADADSEAGRSSGTGKVIEYALTSAMADGKMVFVGTSGGIDGVTNPTLSANVGDTVKVTLSTGDGLEHNIVFPDFNAASEHVVGQGSSTTLEFTPDKGGSFVYYCDLPGHRQAGMEGKFEVTSTTASNGIAAAQVSNNAAAPMDLVVVNNPAATGADIVRYPTEIPDALGERGPQKVRIDLETVEIEGQLADGTTYTYWTFVQRL
jgi:nitrite reductase (NO-forming)